MQGNINLLLDLLGLCDILLYQRLRVMEFIILEENRARSIFGVEYEIEGIEFPKGKGQKIIYKPHTRLFQLCAVPGTKSQGYIRDSKKVMLL